MTRLAGWTARHARLVLVGALALTLLSIWPLSRLSVEADLAALLPEGAPASDDYRVFLETFGGFEKVFVLVRAPGVADAADASGVVTGAADEIAGWLAGNPEVAEARSGITAEDERFFLETVAPRLPLLLPELPADFAARLTPEAIAERAAALRHAVRGPGGVVTAKLAPHDPLGLSEGLLAASSSLPVDPLTGAFLSRDGRSSLVVVTPARAEIDPEGGKALAAELEKAFAEVRRGSPAPLEIQAVGGPLYAAQDEAILRADLTRTATGSALGVVAVLLLGLGGAVLPLLLVLSVLAGLVWTLAGAALGLGSLTAVGIGFAAALVGMGVEFGIHGGTRFRALRADGHDARSALFGAFGESGPGIVSSAFTTAAGLAPLGFAHFRPLRELGVVMTLGIVAALLATLALGAGLFLLGRRWQVARPPRLWRRFGEPALSAGVGFAGRRPVAVLAAVLALSLVAAWGLTRLSFRTDLRSLRPADHPALAAERALLTDFSLGLDTFSVVARGKDLGEALDRAARAREILARRLGSQVEITTPSDWLVLGERRDRRLAALAALPLTRAADDLERELTAAGFRSEPFAAALETLRRLGEGQDPGAPGEPLPRFLSELIHTSAEGAAVAVHVRLPEKTAGQAPPADLVAELDAIAPGAVAVASVPRVGAELRGLALADLSRSSLWAGLLVAAVVLVSVRGRLGLAGLSVLPLALGCLWTFGLWGAFGGHVDLLAISTLPVLFGTAVDLGVHAVVGGRLSAERRIAGTIRESGLAMLLVTLTTGVGFGSLGASRVPGIQNAGTLVALGVSASLLATFLVLPACEGLAERRRKR